MTSDLIDEIVGFWLGPACESPETAAARRDWWYKGGAPVDAEIRARFGPLVPQARGGALLDWQESAEGALALILLLDQFTRNLYRATPAAYSGDALAFEIVTRTIDRGLDAALHPVPRIWLYHPFHHSEDIAEQDRGLSLLEALRQSAPEAWHPYIARSIEGWTRHRDIVARFHRFPHRNTVLGRASTAEERDFLAEDGNHFGQTATPEQRVG